MAYRDKFECIECGHIWKTRKKEGEPPSCSRCSSKSIKNKSQIKRDKRERELKKRKKELKKRRKKLFEGNTDLIENSTVKQRRELLDKHISMLIDEEFNFLEMPLEGFGRGMIQFMYVKRKKTAFLGLLDKGKVDMYTIYFIPGNMEFEELSNLLDSMEISPEGFTAYDNSSGTNWNDMSDLERKKDDGIANIKWEEEGEALRAKAIEIAESLLSKTYGKEEFDITMKRQV